VCTEPAGRLPRFVCPYHAWNYGLDGRLLSAPLREEYGPGFPWPERGLAPVARVARYRGFIFASLSPEGPDLEDFLGASRRGFDEFVDRSPSGELEYVGPPLRYRVRANWKVILENLNDILHPLFAHASAGAAVRAMPDRDKLHPLSRLLAAPPAQTLQGFQALSSTMSPHGHSFISGLVGGAAGAPPRDAYFAALAERHGEDGALRVLQSDLHVVLLYPSATFTPRFQALRLVRPLAVDATEVESHLYRLKGAPPEVFALGLEYGYTSSSPASPVIVDDLEIYERLQAQATAETWMSAERRLGEADAFADGSASAVATSEEYLRRQYAVWARYLDTGAP
jgi:phenylpropionate dioxygenase-like ring-hydroxylating dioxygenase large terminal subunit